MIKPEDLRIGNWIEYDNRYFQIECVSVHFPYLKTAEFGAGVVDWSNMNGIPLAEKVLLDCGFDQISDTNIYVISMHKIGINKLKSLAVYIDENSYTAAIVDYYTGVEKTDLLHMDYQHLHELQNLFYSLTKTELIIKL